MKKLFAIFVLLAAFSLPALAQWGRLSPDDQRKFDKYYSKWIDDTRRNDQDDIAKDIGKMQEIMARYNIPPNVPFNQIASNGSAYPPNAYPGPAYYQWQGRLSPDDQREFDKQYSKWINDTRRNDRDDISKDIGHMQEIMARYNIPPEVPFNQIASNAGAYPYGYPAGTYPVFGHWQGLLSPDDQRDFDKNYSKWLKHTRKNDQDDINKDVRHMQDIMARYNIPANVPFAQIASPDAGSRWW
jgi:hypothetical protein